MNGWRVNLNFEYIMYINVCGVSNLVDFYMRDARIYRREWNWIYAKIMWEIADEFEY